MRARILAAIVALVAGTLVLASVGSFLLIRRDTLSSAESQLRTQVRSIAEHPALLALRLPGERTLRPGRCCLTVLRVVGGFSTLSVNAAEGGEWTRPMPEVLRGVSLPVGRIEAGSSVSGHVGDSVYVVDPMTLNARQRTRFVPAIPTAATPVLVATRDVSAPAGGFGYFAIVGAAVLVIAGAASYFLASRLARPLRRAVDVTGRIAGGDLDARVDVSASDPPELVALRESINTMGDRLSEAREQQRQFLLSVSHDLRTPLTSIGGYAQAVADGTAEDVPAAIEVIRTEAHRLERLVQDLLDLARLDAGRFSFRPEPTEVTPLVVETVESFRPAATRRSLSLDADVPDGDPMMLSTDRDRTRQVLANLIDNALRFARSRVQVGARRDGPGLLLWVTDDGPGIAPEDLERVWDRHFSTDRSGASGAGMGLGLAIVAELVGAMRGVVQAESPVAGEEGTRMVVRLPPL